MIDIWKNNPEGLKSFCHNHKTQFFPKILTNILCGLLILVATEFLELWISKFVHFLRKKSKDEKNHI